MRQVTVEQLKRLIAPGQPPCISLYQPTHRQFPDSRENQTRYRNLVSQVETMLREKYPKRETSSMLERFRALENDNDFWKSPTDGLAVLGSADLFEVYQLQRPVPEIVVVADSFHTKPLIRIVQSADRYQVLCLSRSEARLYEGNRDVLDPVDLVDVPARLEDVVGDESRPPPHKIGLFAGAGAGGAMVGPHGHEPKTDFVEADTIKFFRAVDRGILENHSRPSGLPLMLAALPEHQSTFRELSRNPFLMTDGITGNPDSLDVEQLRKEAWKKVEPLYLARLDELKEKFSTAYSQQHGSGDLSDAARAAVAGRVETVLIEAERSLPGELDRSTGAIRPATDPHVDDMLDDLAELVLAKGGEVVVVPKERMPTDSGLAAIYRF